MSTFTAINGQTVTDETMETLEQAYAQGTFPPTEKNLGYVINGSPRALSPEGSEILSVKIPVAMKRALTATAESQHISTSELVRSIITQHLVEA